jgi:hypothetical protein
MTERLRGLFHAAFAVCNAILAILCAGMIVTTYAAGMLPMCFFNGAMFVANVYMVYFNTFEALRRL